MAHSTRIKVRGYHLDFYGHVNNARYLEFLEEARWNLLEEQVDLAVLRREGLIFVVARITIDYRAPVRLGEEIEIRSSMRRLGTKSGVLHQTVLGGGNGQPAADADVTFAIVEESTGRAVAIPDDLRAVFTADLDAASSESTTSDPTTRTDPKEADPDG